jgi:hypothetical protein
MKKKNLPIASALEVADRHECTTGVEELASFARPHKYMIDCNVKDVFSRRHAQSHLHFL